MFKWLKITKRQVLFVIGLYMTFYFDGSLSANMARGLFGERVIMVSHLALLWLVMAQVWGRNAHLPVLTGAVIVGLGTDIYYSGIVGLAVFGLPLLVWLNQLLLSRVKLVGLWQAGYLLASVAVYELYLYGIESLLGLIHVGIATFMIRIFLPTLILNLVYIILLSGFVIRLYQGHWLLKPVKRNPRAKTN